MPERVGAVEPQVRPVGGPRPRVFVEQVVDAERGAVPGQHLEGVVVQPAGVAQLDRPAHRLRRDREELVQPAGVAWPARRQLDQRRSERGAQACDAVEVVREPRGGIPQLHAVRPELPELEVA